MRFKIQKLPAVNTDLVELMLQAEGLPYDKVWVSPEELAKLTNGRYVFGYVITITHGNDEVIIRSYRELFVFMEKHGLFQ